MLYLYECPECKRKWEEYQTVENRHNVKCVHCNIKANKLISSSGDILTFEPAWFHDICDESIYITSRKQLKEECKKHDVLAARLM